MQATIAKESREWIARLIGFDTTSRNSNLALIECIADYLDRHGVRVRLTHDESGRKANLYATVGPEERGGLLLSGHTDVVPVDDQPWQSDPWTLLEQEGRLYGRGTADMKSFVAVTLAWLPRFQAVCRQVPVHFAFSYDEEVGCLGVRRLLADLADLPVRPRACIVGEPTEMQVVTAHKGKESFTCHVRGHEAHSALTHRGANAIEAAAEVITHLKGMARRFRDQGPFDEGYDPPYTTVHTGTIHGGTALNIVPAACSFEFEWRYLPSADPATLLSEVERAAEAPLAELRAVARDTDIRIEPRSSFPALRTPDEAEVVALAKALSGANATGKVSFGTEAGLFDDAAIPTVVCGPGSIEQAHKPDEFVSLEQIALCEAFMERLCERLARGAL